MRRYRYEDARFVHHLTGLTIESRDAAGKRVAQRIGTWAYDTNGRGILSVKGEPKRLDKDGRPVAGTGIEQVNLVFAPGTTRLTNSLGQTTTYTHAIVGNEYRLLQVRGAGCASCGEANVRYGYDALGRLTDETKLGPTGQPIHTTRTERDGLGRVVRESRIDYANGKPLPAKLVARYAYAGASSEPGLIARPSVIPGKEAITRITYNAYGQPTQITETGFSPLDDDGQATPTPITRTTTYAYTRINHRSLLVQIDGPLANGPKNSPADSDVTRIEWDGRGRVLAIVPPGDLKSPVRYDAAGRVAAVGRMPWSTPSSPAPGRDEPASPAAVTFDTLARPVAWQSGGAAVLKAAWGEAGTAAQWRILSLSSRAGEARRLIDDFGRVVAIRTPGMGWQTAVYDAGDRLARIVDPRGAVQVAHYDFAGRLLKLERTRPGERQAEEIITLAWQGVLKTAASVTDAEGRRRTLYRYDAQGRLGEETQEIALNDRPPVRFSVRRQWHETGERIELADARATHSAILQTRDAQGHPATIDLAGALPRWLMGGRSLVRQIDWTNVADTLFAQRIVYGDGRADRWPLPSPPARADGDPAAQRIALADPLADAGLARPGHAHDAAGLPAMIDTDAGRLRLDWDAAGRLREIRQGETSERFIYDAQGRRVAKRIGNQIRYFAWDGIQLAGEADETGKLQTRYVYLGYRPIAQIAAPQSLWQRFSAWLFGPAANTYATSKSGRALALYDERGQLLWQDAARTPLQKASLPTQHHQPLRDVAQYADDESGLVYHVARFFDPATGFFLSPDPRGIADVVEDTRPDLMLNPYAYAGGYPDEFFDPDGAAKIRYYAITTGDRGGKKGYGSLGQPQGFTNARWAFVIYDIQGGGDNRTDLGRLRNQYATTNTGLLFDGRGNFIGGANDPLTGVVNPTRTSLKWEGAGTGKDIVKGFYKHYDGSIIGLPQFDIEFNDDNATKLIWYLMGKTEIRDQCTTSAPGWLPEIRFYPGEADIKVTQANASGANRQRILNCQRPAPPNALQVPYASDEERRRVEKYQAAAELTETSSLGRDCSRNGCPGVAITGQSGHVYRASYGRTQMIGSTFLEKVDGGLNAAEKAAVGITADIQRRITAARARAFDVQRRRSGSFDRYRDRYTCATAAQAWDRAGQPALPNTPSPLTVDERAAFLATGLNRQAFIDMICFVPQGVARPEGEGRAAFGTEAIFSDVVLRDWMMGVFRSDDGGAFDYISRVLIRDNLRTVLNSRALSGRFANNEPPTLPDAQPSPAYVQRQRAIEEELAMRTARLHNGGQTIALSPDPGELTRRDQGNYVHKFIGLIAGHGEWRSLRCAEEPTQTWRGLEMQVLKLK